MREITVGILITLSILLLRCGEENVGPTAAPPIPTFEYNIDPPYIIFTITSEIKDFSIDWDFGNGETSSDSVATAYYPVPGEYTVTLAVSNSVGTTTYIEKVVVTVGIPSVPSFKYDDSDPNNIVFTVTSDLEDFSISWDFGNGETSSDSVATAYYPTLGEYTVTLTVSNVAGSTSYEEEIVVKLVEPDVPNFSYDDSNLNNIVFTVTSDTEGVSISWDFGNGETSSDLTDVAYYPFPGEYAVTLTVSNVAGSTSYEEGIVVTAFDSTVCDNEELKLLTGGCDAENGKTWVWDSLGTGARARGRPVWGASTYNDPVDVSWWEADPGALPDELYNDEYTFILEKFKYINDCKGDFLYDWAWANELKGTTQERYDDIILSYEQPQPCNWNLKIDNDGNKLLTLSDNNWIGLVANSYTYQIMKLAEDTLYLRYEYYTPGEEDKTGEDRLEWWYIRLLQKGHQR